MSDTEQRSGNGGAWISGFLMGAIVGAAVAMLTARRSGEETRQMLTERGQVALDRASEYRGKAMDMATSYKGKAMDMAANYKDKAVSKASDMGGQVRDRAANMRERMRQRMVTMTGKDPEGFDRMDREAHQVSSHVHDEDSGTIPETGHKKFDDPMQWAEENTPDPTDDA